MKTKTNTAARRLGRSMSMVLVALYQTLLTLKIPCLMIGLLLFTLAAQASIEITNTTNPIGGDCNGSIEITITPDPGYELAEPFMFNGVPQNAELGSTTIVQVIEGLCEGSHQIIVENFFGCQKVLSVYLSCGFDIQATTHDNCDGTGGISIQEIPGPTPSFSWTDAAGSPVGENTPTLDNVPFGEYCVEVRNAEHCYGQECFILEEEPFEVEVALTTRPTSSPNASDGVIELEILDPIAAYTIEVTGDCSYSNVMEGFGVFTFEDLCRGSYQIKVTNNSCETVLDVVIETCLDITISPEPLITGTSSCKVSDGSINFWGAGDPIISGGTPPYSLEWSNGETGFEIYNLGVGIYSLIIRDSKGCSNVFSYEVHSQPVLENVVITPYLNGCENNTGAIELEFECEAENFEFNWASANGTETTTTEVGVLSNLQPGEYCVQIIANDREIPLEDNCFNVPAQGNYTLLYPEATYQYPCSNTSEDGLIDVDILGAIVGDDINYDNLVFQWSNGETTEDAYHLSAGTHSLVITDEVSGCVWDFVFPGLSVHPSVDNLNTIHKNACEDAGEIGITNVSDNSNFSFLWSNGAIAPTITPESPGLYTVTVTQSGCNPVEYSFNFEDKRPTIAITAIQGVTATNGDTGGNGRIEVNITGGTPPYSYQWIRRINPNSFEQNMGAYTDADGNLIDVAQGIYTLTVTDQNGCKKKLSYELKFCPSFEWSIEGNFNEFHYVTGGGSGALAINVLSEMGDVVGEISLDRSFHIEWTYPSGTTADTRLITGLSEEGEYCVRVWDDCGKEERLCFTLGDCSYRNNLYFNHSSAVVIKGQDFCMNNLINNPKLLVEITSNDIENYFSPSPNETHKIFTIIWPDGQQTIFDCHRVNGNWEWTRYGIEEYIITDPNTYSVEIIDGAGCHWYEVFAFSDKRVPVTEFRMRRIGDYLPSFPEPDLQVYAYCETCKGCGGNANNYFNLFCDDVAIGGPQPQENFFTFESNDQNLSSPCKAGGKISCGGEEAVVELEVLPSDYHTEIINYDEVVGMEDGKCLYKTHCVFAPGTVTGYAESFYVETVAKGNCDETGGGIQSDCYVPGEEITCEEYCISNPSTEPETCEMEVSCSESPDQIEATVIVEQEYVYQGAVIENYLNACNIFLQCPINPCFKNSVYDCSTPENCPDAAFLSSIGVDPLSDNEEGYSCEDISNALAFIDQCDPMLTDGENEINYRMEQDTMPLDVISEEVETVHYATQIHPNPFSNYLTLSLQSPKNQILHLILYDLLGRTHHSQQQEVQSGSNSFQLQLPPQLPNGVLFLEIRDQAGNVESHRVVHQSVERGRDD